MIHLEHVEYKILFRLYSNSNNSISSEPLVSPGRVVNEGLRLVFGELLGLELVNGGYSRPVVFCGSACGGTFIQPS